MAKVRTNLSIPAELHKRLKGLPDVKWSAIAEAALWQVVNGDSEQNELYRLREEVTQLRIRLADIQRLATEIVGTAKRSLEK
jgi:hypothetical protein